MVIKCKIGQQYFSFVSNFLLRQMSGYIIAYQNKMSENLRMLSDNLHEEIYLPTIFVVENSQKFSQNAIRLIIELIWINIYGKK